VERKWNITGLVIALLALFAIFVGLAPWERSRPAVAEAVTQVAAPAQAPASISTQGRATVRVKPDSARIFFSVTRAATTVEEVRNANVASTNDVMARLEALRMKNMFTKTSTMSVRIIWKNNDPLTIQGYHMTNTFTVRVVNKDVEKLAEQAGRVVDVALAAGANEISDITFFREDDGEDRRQCMMAAVEDARANAEALAKAAGGQLGGARSISGYPEFRYGGRQTMSQAGMPTDSGGEASSPVPGEVELNCQVQASYDLQA
jgi:uncharacterized protein